MQFPRDKHMRWKSANQIARAAEQVGNPTSTTSHLKRRETKDVQGSAHFFYDWVFKLTLKLIFKIGI
jgi:hypothetical protein